MSTIFPSTHWTLAKIAGNCLTGPQRKKQNYKMSFFRHPGTDVMIFLNIFAEKISNKIGFFSQTTASFCKNCDRNIGF
jgi:hypothetical protein